MSDNIGAIESSPMTMTRELRKVLKRRHYPREVMLECVRWYAAYPLRCPAGQPMSAADQFYSLAFCTSINRAPVFDSPKLMRQNPAASGQQRDVALLILPGVQLKRWRQTLLPVGQFDLDFQHIEVVLALQMDLDVVGIDIDIF